MITTQAPKTPGLLQRLLLLWQRNPLFEAVREAYSRHGRVRVNVLIGWVLISIVSIASVVVVHVYFTDPAVDALGLGNAAASNSFLRKLLAITLLVVVLVAAATYMVLHLGVIRPVEAFRERIQRQLTESGQQQNAEIAALAYGSQKRTEQLEAALADNEIMRREKQELSSAHETLDQLFKTTFESITDRLILLGPTGKVVEVSPMTTELIGLHRTRIIGEDFDNIINLYDPLRDNPLEYRLKDLATQVLQSGSSIPKITPALLLTPHGQQEKILLSVSAILDPNARVVGASIRIESDTASITASGGGSRHSVKADRVTGLPMRDMFNSRLKELIEQARVRNATHTLMLIGADNVTNIMDTFGHRAAEELFWNIAQVIQAEVGSGITCYRVTASYIGVLFPFSEREAVEGIGRRICGSVSGRVFAWREARYECTVSGGAIEIGPDSEGLEIIMEMADSALQHARSLGGNRIYRLEPDEKTSTRRRSDQEWINWLMPRLENGALHLISQSIVPLVSADTRLPMFEVFMRVEDEDGVWVSPGAFMGAASRHQKCSHIDLAVLKTVLHELDRNPQILEKHLCASINISGCALEDPDFASNAAQAILLSGIPGNRLCFEIDEPYVMSHRSVFMRFASAMKSCGVKLALDHYKAAGGIDSLIDTPISYVKIHESMVRRLAGDLSDPASRLSLTWINEVCHARRIATIAAGIEDGNSVDVLKAAGTDFGQGVYLNKMGPLMI